MKSTKFMSLLLAVLMTMTMGAGLTFAAHPDIPLYTYEEIGMQFTQGYAPAPGDVPGTQFSMMPVAVPEPAPGYPLMGSGMPYSPKMTCGNCHNDSLTRWDRGPAQEAMASFQAYGNPNQDMWPDEAMAILDADGNPITEPLVSYDNMMTQAFHSELGAEEWQHDPQGPTKSSQPGKPWSQTNGMWGKW